MDVAGRWLSRRRYLRGGVRLFCVLSLVGVAGSDGSWRSEVHDVGGIEGGCLAHGDAWLRGRAVFVMGAAIVAMAVACNW